MNLFPPERHSQAEGFFPEKINRSDIMRMSCAIFCLFTILLLSQTSFAYMPKLFVSGSTGIDNNTCGGSASAPCATIKKALSHIGEGGIIRIAQGDYTEADMQVKVDQNVTFEGGWNTDFSHQSCTPSATTIISGNNDIYDILFWISSRTNGHLAAMAIKCVTLKKGLSGDITKAVQIYSDSGGQAEFSMDNSRITGFGKNVISVYSFTNGKISTSIKNSTLDNNPAENSRIIDVNTNSGKITVYMDHVYLIHNGITQQHLTPLDMGAFGSGAIEASFQNTVIAGNQTGNLSPLSIEAQNNSSIALQSLNNTITNNTSNRWRGYGLEALAFDSSQVTINLQNTILRGNQGNSTQKYEMYFQQSDNATLSFVADYSMLGTHSSLGNVTYTPSHEVHGDPRLNSAYHLRSGSPAIDAGLCGYSSPPIILYHRIAPYDDIDGDKRPGFGAILGCDIGADEYKPFPWPMFLPAITYQR